MNRYSLVFTTDKLHTDSVQWCPVQSKFSHDMLDGQAWARGGPRRGNDAPLFFLMSAIN